MKKFLLTFCLLASIVVAANAQPRAIGARVGWNLEFSYQHAIASRNMIDLTAGVTNFFNNAAYVDANCVFDWVFNINGGWNWYVGPGLGVGYGFGSHWRENDYIPFRLNIGGQIGVEYQFGIPLNLSLDWRPMWNVMGAGHGFFYGEFCSFGLGVRYRF